MSQAELETLLDLFKRVEPNPEASVEERRAETDKLVAFIPIPEDIGLQTRTLAGVACDEVRAPGASPQTVVLYLHGGGYAICSPRTHRRLAYDISAASGATCVVPDYRLAPEHPFPAAVEDAVAVYGQLIDDGISPSRIVVAGDSAGGGLTVATLLRLRDQGQPLPAAGVCLSPWTDMQATGESMTSKADVDPMVRRDGLEQMAAWYLNGADPRDPLASPIHADLSGLPPLLVQVGGDETLLDDASRLAERARAHGVEVAYEEWERMFHVWHLFAHMLSEGRDAISRIGDFVATRTAG
jgi:acetyl esterase/lipase